MSYQTAVKLLYLSSRCHLVSSYWPCFPMVGFAGSWRGCRRATEEAIANELGMSQSAVSKAKTKIVEKYGASSESIQISEHGGACSGRQREQQDER